MTLTPEGEQRLTEFSPDGQMQSDFAATIVGTPSRIHAEPDGNVLLAAGTSALVNIPWIYVNGRLVSRFCRVLAKPRRSRFVVQSTPVFLFADILGANVLERDPVAFEFGAAVALTFQRQGENSALARIGYRTRDGSQSAKAGEDYVASHGLIEFAPFENEKTILIPIINDC